MFRFFVLSVCLLVSIGCGLSPESESAIKDAIAINAGHVRDTTLPESARMVALDNHDLLISVLYNEGSIAEIPSDVRARKDARDASKGGGK